MSASLVFRLIRFNQESSSFGPSWRWLTTTDPENGLAYVGLDFASAMQPQTLLCDTMNWRPHTLEHWAALRLYLAVKCGYKSLKRIGLIRFQGEQPPDHCGDRGYDRYARL
jgi:DMSO/TMAO reductase YedYZ molybdopterin-dependent catalytic subunit